MAEIYPTTLFDENGNAITRNGEIAKVTRLDKTGKNKGGRPLKFKSASALQTAIDSYFDSAEKMTIPTKKGDTVEINKPYTLEGLALHLDCSTDTLRYYAKSDFYCDIIERARQKMLASWFEMGLTGQYSDRVLSMIVPANHPEYNIKQQVDVTASTVEDKLREIREKRKQAKLARLAGSTGQDVEKIEDKRNE